MPERKRRYLVPAALAALVLALLVLTLGRRLLCSMAEGLPLCSEGAITMERSARGLNRPRQHRPITPGTDRAIAASLGVGLLHFEFEEFDSQDRRLVKESGWLQGLEGRRQVPMPRSWRNAYERWQSSDNTEAAERSVITCWRSSKTITKIISDGRRSCGT